MCSTFLFSFDARKTEVDDGTHWSDTSLLNQRAYFKFLPPTPWHKRQSVTGTSFSSHSYSPSRESLTSNPERHELASYPDHEAHSFSAQSSYSPSMSMSVSSHNANNVQSQPNAMGAQLELYPVEDRDQAVYRCRVDFLLSPTKNTIINFTVISEYYI